MIEEIFIQYADKGFAYAVSFFLLWKGYQQDKEYLAVLEDLKISIEQHVAQKDALIELLYKKGE